MADEEPVFSVQYVDGDCETSNWISRPGKCIVSYTNGDTFAGYYARMTRRYLKGQVRVHTLGKKLT